MTADVEATAPVQCGYKTDRGRQCKLLTDAATGVHLEGKPDVHKFVIRTPSEERPVMPRGVILKAERVPEAHRVTRENSGRDPLPRDAQQKQVDTDMHAIYLEWVKAGKPAETDKWPQARYVVPPEAVDAVLYMLRRATQKGAPAEGKSMRYVRGKHTSGKTIIAFSCGEKPPVPSPSSS